MSLASKYTGRLKASCTHVYGSYMIALPNGFSIYCFMIFFLIFIIIRNRVSPKELCNQRFQSRVIENNNFLSLPFPCFFDLDPTQGMDSTSRKCLWGNFWQPWSHESLPHAQKSRTHLPLLSSNFTERAIIEPLRGDEIKIFNGVLELNIKKAEVLMMPLKVRLLSQSLSYAFWPFFPIKVL